MIEILIANQNSNEIKVKFNIGHQPPKNRIEIKADISSMLLYSPKKNIANVIAEYSIKKPATNSASASGRSKGALFVSANIEIKNIINKGNSGNIYQVFFCE
jgi:hypothetical protein